MKKEGGNAIISYHLKSKADSQQNERLNSSDISESSGINLISPQSSLKPSDTPTHNLYLCSKTLVNSLSKLIHQLKRPLPPLMDLENQNKLLRRENQKLKDKLTQTQQSKGLNSSSNSDINKLKQKAKALLAENDSIKREIIRLKAHSLPKQELKYEDEFLVDNMVDSMKELVGLFEKFKKAGENEDDDDEAYANDVINSNNNKSKFGYH